MQEFATTFNCGLGFVLVVGQEGVEETLDVLRRAGETIDVVGRLIERDGKGCVLRHMESWI
jgi:phosphoribosylaminoimidazole (AIR) synthetase